MQFLWIFPAILCLFLLWMFAIAGRGRMPAELMAWRYAHRGLHDLRAGVPENSLEAFRLAAGGGFGAELDIHLTRDGRLAVMHDSSLARACGIQAVIEELDAAQLAAFRLFGTGAEIPFLEDVLPLFEDRGPLLIELKTYRRNARPLAAALCRAVEGYRGALLVESFDPRALRALRRLRPDLPRGQLSKNFRRDRGYPLPMALLLGGLCCNFLSRPDFIAYRFSDRRSVPLRLCRRLFGAAEMDWTITSPEALREVENDGAAAIFEGFRPGDRTAGGDRVQSVQSGRLRSPHCFMQRITSTKLVPNSDSVYSTLGGISL